MKIKICGLTRVEDALHAEALGADYIGMVFAKHSPRCVTVAQATSIVNTLTTAIPVGVFIDDRPFDEALSIAKVCGITTLQVYYPVDQVIEGVTLIEAIPVNTTEDLARYTATRAAYCLFDTKKDNSFGGLGVSFDWTLLPKNGKAFFLAGGINVTNLAQAMAHAPYAVDVSSGVESSPGIKDHTKLQTLFEIFTARKKQ